MSREPSLIFFAWLVMFMVAGFGCDEPDHVQLSMIHTGGKATAISIDHDALIAKGAVSAKLEDTGYLNSRLVVRADQSATNIIGTILPGKEKVVFEPAFPFRPGKKFQVYFEDKLVAGFMEDLPDSSTAAIIREMYPSTDTIPENLLKFYLTFSAPMREGQALNYIHLLNESGDTVKDVFLDLQPELWNPERTVLTVWLDPGRIKRDLIPNLAKGKPLEAGAAYRINVSAKWTDARGMNLQNDFSRRLVVAARDSLTPGIERWRLTTPVSKTLAALMIDFEEPIDYYLAGECITIRDGSDRIIEGRISIGNNEKGLSFYPVRPWLPGIYQIRVNSKLEDLAGNNLNRPFDNDALANTARNKNFYTLEFRVQ